MNPLDFNPAKHSKTTTKLTKELTYQCQQQQQRPKKKKIDYSEVRNHFDCAIHFCESSHVFNYKNTWSFRCFIWFNRNRMKADNKDEFFEIKPNYNIFIYWLSVTKAEIAINSFEIGDFASATIPHTMTTTTKMTFNISIWKCERFGFLCVEFLFFRVCVCASWMKKQLAFEWKTRRICKRKSTKRQSINA